MSVSILLEFSSLSSGGFDYINAFPFVISIPVRLQCMDDCNELLACSQNWPFLWLNFILSQSDRYSYP